MLDPRDIDNKEFATTRLKEGYDQSEVDDFLDRVAADYRQLQQELAKALQENEILRRRPTEAPTVNLPVVPQAPSAIAEKLLAAAEEAARQHESEAKVRADEIVRDAGAQGSRIVEEAKEAAEKIKSEGLAEKYRRVEELNRERDELSTAVADLRTRGERIKAALSDALNNVSERL